MKNECPHEPLGMIYNVVVTIANEIDGFEWIWSLDNEISETGESSIVGISGNLSVTTGA